MRSSFLIRRIFVFLVLSTSLLVWSEFEHINAGPQSGELFVPLAMMRQADTYTDPGVLRVRYVDFDFELLSDSRVLGQTRSFGPIFLQLNLFPDAMLTAVYERTVPSRGGFTWIGQVDQVEQSSVILVVRDGVMSGSITLPWTAYQIRYTPHGVHAIYEVDRSAYPPESEPIPVFPEPSRDAAPVSASDDGTLFDLMVVYTEAARVGAGSTAAIETLIQLGVTETNIAYQNSEITPRLRLVHMQEVDYTEHSSASTNLSRLRNTSDGFMDEVHTLRNSSGADLVKLITNGPSGFCGVAYLMSGNNSGFATSAFSVTRRTCVSPNYTFEHEIGHNLGCNHAPEDPVGTGAFPYSFAYKDPGSEFRTIMAYNSGCSCPRVLYHSNPDVNRNDLPTGTSSQNNALSINNVSTTVANFRESTIHTLFLPVVKKSNAPASPSNLQNHQTWVIHSTDGGLTFDRGERLLFEKTSVPGAIHLPEGRIVLAFVDAAQREVSFW